MELENQKILMTRRRLMGLVFCAGTGLMLGASQADAMWNVMEVVNSSTPGEDKKAWRDIPPALRGVIGSDKEAYTRFLQRIGLRRISIQQIVDSHAKAHGNVHNTLPPRQLWRNIQSTLRTLDKISVHLGEPVQEVVSVYRSPAYNALCPGAKSHSYHLRNNAIDFRCRTSPRQVAAVVREMRSKGLFRGGVGRYSSFTHLDTRGINADW